MFAMRIMQVLTNLLPYFLNDIYFNHDVSNPDRFNAAKDPSQNEMEQNDINDCEDAFSFFASFE